MEKSSLIIFIIIVVILFIPGAVVYYNFIKSSGCRGDTVEMENYYVNEWGIFKQEYNKDNGTYLMGPQPGIVPKPDVVEEVKCKPVIYFHGNGNMDLSVSIATSASEIRTIPDSKKVNIPMDSNREMTFINWDLKIAGDINDQRDDAKVITSSDEAFEYLFYEGKSDYYQNILVSVTKLYGNIFFPDGLKVSIQNIGSYEMEDVYIICDLNLGEPKRMLHFSELKQDEIINQTKSWNDWINCSDLRGMLKDDLIDRNLKDEEAEDLLDYWVDGEVDENGMSVDRTLLEPEGKGTVQVLLFISEEEYDHKLPIKFSKEPSSINRVGICYVFNVPIIIQI